MTNDQMTAGRYLRWHRARIKYAWIVAQIAAGRTVYLTTAIRTTKITANHISAVKATKTGLMILCGKKWVDYSLTTLSAS